jgi:RNA polymerase sigma factor (sigma-70 family)
MAVPYHDKNDAELLEHFHSSGNSEWLGILLQRYTAMLLGVCMKYLKNEDDAKDAVQQIFLKTVNELQKYKVTYFKSWLYMIAKNHCLMKLRDAGKRTLEIKDDNIAFENNGEQKILAEEKENSLNDLEKAIERLTPEQKVCITLFYLEKQSYKEIALTTDYSILQIKSNIQNGKRNLKIHMQRMHNNEH